MWQWFRNRYEDDDCMLLRVSSQPKLPTPMLIFIYFFFPPVVFLRFPFNVTGVSMLTEKMRRKKKQNTKKNHHSFSVTFLILEHFRNSYFSSASSSSPSLRQYLLSSFSSWLNMFRVICSHVCWAHTKWYDYYYRMSFYMNWIIDQNVNKETFLLEIPIGYFYSCLHLKHASHW